MLIKATVIFNIEPTVNDFVEGNPYDTMEKCICGFLECSKCQCEWQDDRCINAECEGCKGFTVLSVKEVGE